MRFCATEHILLTCSLFVSNKCQFGAWYGSNASISTTYSRVVPRSAVQAGCTRVAKVCNGNALQAVRSGAETYGEVMLSSQFGDRFTNKLTVEQGSGADPELRGQVSDGEHDQYCNRPGLHGRGCEGSPGIYVSRYVHSETRCSRMLKLCCAGGSDTVSKVCICPG